MVEQIVAHGSTSHRINKEDIKIELIPSKQICVPVVLTPTKINYVKVSKTVRLLTINYEAYIELIHKTTATLKSSAFNKPRSVVTKNLFTIKLIRSYLDLSKSVRMKLVFTMEQGVT